jgi:prepilin-type N-terminal cleavage/methylation domain-containing protein
MQPNAIQFPISDRIRLSQSQRGVSLVEILIAMSMIAILGGVAVLQFSATNESYNADNCAYKILNYCREASSRAVSDHHSYRVVINTNTNNISMINEMSSASGNGEGDTINGDDVLVKQEPVGTRVSFTQPTGISAPPSPYNYAAATFSSGQWTVHFMSDGSVTDPFAINGVPVSCTLFVSPTDKSNPIGLIRAVTLFGSSSSAKFWMYTTVSNSFVQG